MAELHAVVAPATPSPARPPHGRASPEYFYMEGGLLPTTTETADGPNGDTNADACGTELPTFAMSTPGAPSAAPRATPGAAPGTTPGTAESSASGGRYGGGGDGSYADAIVSRLKRSSSSEPQTVPVRSATR